MPCFSMIEAHQSCSPSSVSGGRTTMWTPADREKVGDYGCGRALSNEQWKIIEPFIPPEKPGGRHREVDMRAVLNAIFYVVRTGCQWRHLPPPPLFPPSSTVY